MTIELSRLKEPFKPEVVSFRVGSVKKDKTKATALFYIDARDVRDRLDEVCGPENWQCRFPICDPSSVSYSDTRKDKGWDNEEKPSVSSRTSGKTICEIGIRINDEWIWKSDGAGDSDVESEKGAISDALKRAAVCWGVGRYLYDLPSPWMEIDKWKQFTDESKQKLLAILKGVKPVEKPVQPAKTLAQRMEAFSKHLDSMRTKQSVDNAVTASNALMKELKEKLPQDFDKISIKINQIKEAYDLADQNPLY